MASHPKKSQKLKSTGRQKVAEPVKKDGKWRVRCYKCGVLRPVYGSWTTAATAAWRHGRH
jgi:hypothetical protein